MPDSKKIHLDGRRRNIILESRGHVRFSQAVRRRFLAREFSSVSFPPRCFLSLNPFFWKNRTMKRNLKKLPFKFRCLNCKSQFLRSWLSGLVCLNYVFLVNFNLSPSNLPCKVQALQWLRARGHPLQKQHRSKRPFFSWWKVWFWDWLSA